MKNTIVKVISILMALSLTMLTFAACGEKEEFEKTATKKIKRFLYTKDEDSDINRKS